MSFKMWHSIKILFIIFIVATCIGFVFIFTKPLSYYTFSTEYDLYARNMLAGRGFTSDAEATYTPDVYRVPGYSLFLCLMYKIFGINYFFVMMVQVFLNSSVCIFIFYITRRYFNLRFAYLVSFTVAIYPFTTIFVQVIYSEILCIFLFSLGIFLFERGRESEKILFFILSGIVFGYCLLVRPGTALFSLFLTGAYFAIADIKKIWRHLLVFNFCVMLVWSPWIIRNYRVSGRFIPLTIEGKEMVYWATGAIGKYFENRMDNPKFVNQMKDIHKKLEDSKLIGMNKKIMEEDLYFEYAIKNVRDNPISYLFAVIKRIPRMWISKIYSDDTGRSYGYEIFGGKQILFDLVKYFTMSNLLLAVYGIWAVRHNLKKYIFLMLPIIYFSLTHAFLLAEARFTLPARPFLLIFALIGFLNLLENALRKFKIPVSNLILPHP